MEIYRSLGRERIFRDVFKPLDTYADVEFITFYRITRPMFLELHGNIGTFSSRYTSHSISEKTQLTITLQFLATCSFETVVASALGISQPSVSNCI